MVKIYTVHEPAGRSASDGESVFVREGFCWPALLFGVFWALWHRMWVVSVALLAVSMIAGLAVELAGLTDAMSAVLQAAVQLGAGLFGNDLRRWSLDRAGYVESAVVAAERRDAAEHRYYAALAGAVPQTAVQS
jgi:hypothetical protein